MNHIYSHLSCKSISHIILFQYNYYRIVLLHFLMHNYEKCMDVSRQYYKYVRALHTPCTKVFVYAGYTFSGEQEPNVSYFVGNKSR